MAISPGYESIEKESDGTWLVVIFDDGGTPIKHVCVPEADVSFVASETHYHCAAMGDGELSHAF